KIIVPAGNIVGQTGQGPAGQGGAGQGGAGQATAGSGSNSGQNSGEGNVTIASASALPRGQERTGKSGTGANAPGSPVVITRPANGIFDAVVVQTGVGIPEGKDLLSGRPVYTVYIPVGAPKEWALYFCVPGEKPPPDSGTRVVQISNAAPVRAPYPFRIVRPAIVLPAYERHVLIHGFVSDAGRFRDLKIVGEMLPQTSQALLASLNGWEFRAATRDGVPITVEFLLAIPAKGL
ncbi:MAG TPA: hypothetical protein VFW83_02575, partial [Bryobacteraceae bacterium]|nr:hypothetical protein [Bryobacteraceae bacterium]